jgi:DNA polymerase epsilon subunit 2
VHQVFRKFSNSLSPEALEFVENILVENEIQDINAESSVEVLAKEYNKQDGA